jgi:uncharacterized cupredoxin-like copper-binding protein
MKLTTLTASILLISATSVIASGTHDGGHGHTISDEHKHKNIQASPVGDPAEYALENRQVEVILKDTMRIEFFPALNELKDGEAVTFIILNEGKIPHEFTFGTAEEQSAHAEMMKKMPDMKHNDDTSVSLAPGAEAEINWRFAGEAEVVFACNIPGHFEAGMHHTSKIISEVAVLK